MPKTCGRLTLTFVGLIWLCAVLLPTFAQTTRSNSIEIAVSGQRINQLETNYERSRELLEGVVQRLSKVETSVVEMVWMMRAIGTSLIFIVINALWRAVKKTV